MFFALLLSDVVAVVMLEMNIDMNIVLSVGALVFVILAVVLILSSNARNRVKKREQEANAKIAELQDQMEEALKK